MRVIKEKRGADDEGVEGVRGRKWWKTKTDKRPFL